MAHMAQDTENNRKKGGFTLVELSIVLVILGLLVGGVLAGQSLIHSAELKSVIRERDQYEVAVNAFKAKYDALPGDMRNAYAFWSATCGTNTTAASTGCNGNGNGLIEGDATVSESTKAWEHLSQAGMVEGNFDGTGSLVGGVVVLSTSNSPKAKIGGIWNIGYEPCECLTGNQVMVALGEPDAGNGGWVLPSLVLTNSDVWNMDTKLDDGYSNTGSVMGSNTTGVCYDGPNDPYSLSTEANVKGQCIPQFQIK